MASVQEKIDEFYKNSTSNYESKFVQLFKCSVSTSSKHRAVEGMFDYDVSLLQPKIKQNQIATVCDSKLRGQYQPYLKSLDFEDV